MQRESSLPSNSHKKTLLVIVIPILAIAVLSTVWVYGRGGGGATHNLAILVSSSVTVMSGFVTVVNPPTDNNLPIYQFVLRPNSTGLFTVYYTSLGEPGGDTPVQALNKSIIPGHDPSNFTDVLTPLFGGNLVEEMSSNGQNTAVPSQSVGLTLSFSNLTKSANGDITVTYLIKASPSARQGTYYFPIWGMPYQYLTIGDKPYAGQLPPSGTSH